MILRGIAPSPAAVAFRTKVNLKLREAGNAIPLHNARCSVASPL